MFLPGVYPSTLLASLKRLDSLGLIEKGVLAKSLAYVRQKTIPKRCCNNYVVPHPLDYDWRFSDEGKTRLVGYSCEYSDTGDTIALLGVPSLFNRQQVLPNRDPFSKRKVVLIVKNRLDSRASSDREISSNDKLHLCDITTDDPPPLSAQVVLTDPPWYPEYINAFLWSATQICRIGGYIFLCLPQAGTRASISTELHHTLSWAEDLGLTLVKYEPNFLSYVSPPFERNALRSEGIETVPEDWRNGDLAVFSRIRKSIVARAPVQKESGTWSEVILAGVRIRVKTNQKIKVHDPRLISVVPGDILPSVSRREPKREMADVWTSGNRIFACKDCNLLLKILTTIAKGHSPFNAISTDLDHELRPYEKECISDTIRAIRKIVELERQEQNELGYNA
jgi:hypothetical protein